MRKFGFSVSGAEQSLIVLANNEFSNDDIVAMLEDMIISIKLGVYDNQDN